MSFLAKYLLQLRAERETLFGVPYHFPRFALVLLDEESKRIASDIIGAGL